MCVCIGRLICVRMCNVSITITLLKRRVLSATAWKIFAEKQRDTFTDHMQPYWERFHGIKFRCANRVLRKPFDPSSSYKGRRRRRETRSILNPVYRRSY